MTRLAIICVDDEEVILSSLGEQLKRSFGKEYDIELAASGKEALLLCAELIAEGIDIPLIISDQIMPGIQGDELLVQLHSQYPQTLKILLTGQATADSVGNIVNAAALYRYITKPWNETDLILTVKEALRRYGQEQQLAAQNEELIKVNTKLKTSLSLLLATFEATADGILVLDRTEKIVSSNQKFIELWGIPESIMTGQDDEKILTVALEQLIEPDTFNFRTHAQFNSSVDFLKLKNGKIVEYYLQPQRLEGEIVGQVWSFRDVTERQRAEAAVQHQAYHDALTGLPNRVFYDRQLAVALANAQQAQSMLAVMFLDLDRFKVVNDTLGHAMGDLLLQGVVERLSDCIREGDAIARWGGDEFTLLLPEISCREDASAIAIRILETFKPAFLLNGHSLHVTSSIGIAVYPDDGKDADTLLKNADAALYRSKERGRNDYQHYTLTINSQTCELLAIENSLNYALGREEFILYYQPQVNTTTNEIVGMEALVRWQHPTLGLVSPQTFIPLAEENALILPLGEWILQTACAQNKAWQEMSLPPIRMAVNLSARQFQQRNLVQTVARILHQTGLNSSFLELEITETTAMQNADLAKAILLDLSRIGIYLSIDDFGTGYSSLSYLKEFPFHTLKIDQSFIAKLSRDRDVAILKAIISLGQELNLKIVAEGVETAELKDLLQTLKCEYIQGCFFSPPLPAAEATKLLQNHAYSIEIHNFLK